MTEQPTADKGAKAGTDPKDFFLQSREIVQQLAVLIRNAYLLDLGNALFVELTARMSELLSKVIATEGGFKLERSGQDFFANATRMRMEIRYLHAYKYVWKELEKRQLGGFHFVAVPTKEGYFAFLTILKQIVTPAEGNALLMNQMLATAGADAIEALPQRDDNPSLQSAKSLLDRRQRAIHAYEQALEFIRESLGGLSSPAQVNLRRAKRTVQRLVDLSYEEGDGFSLAGLAAIKDHDNYTFNHMVNVCVLAIAFGQRLGLKKRDLAALGLSALYHDMGKLHIPLEVLNKKGKLDDAEWATMGNHTVWAARSLFPLLVHDPSTVDRIYAALQHHLGVDATGYPNLLLRRKQTLHARIIAIVDTFDAMTTKRVYQQEFLPDQALTVLQKGIGKRYDPLLVKAFVNCMGIFPVGSAVVLSSGEIGVVVSSNPDPDFLHQPTVKVVTDAGKQPVEPVLRDLAKPGTSGRILQCVDPDEYGLDPAAFAI